MYQVNIENLTKYYGKHKIFENINLALTPAKLTFLTGENGTGKSTFIKCLLELTNYQGKIKKEGLTFSYVPEKITLPDYINIKNFLYLVASTKKIEPSVIDESINYYLTLFNIIRYENTPLYKLSKGTKQKVIIIQALISQSDVYIFDEPLTALDEESRKIFIKELSKLKQKGKIIVIATHHIDEFNFRNKNIIKFPHYGSSLK